MTDVHPGRRRRRRGRWRGALSALVLTAAVTGLGSFGIVTAAHRTAGNVARVPAVAAVLTPVLADIENYLLVGSDSRADADPTAPDAGGIGSESQVTGRRSDTIMVLRLDRPTGTASLLSIPRDLYVELSGPTTAPAKPVRKARINSAFNDGADALVQTVQHALGIPLQHYVEIDFSGFKDLVDAIGGVRVCFALPTRDTNTGLSVPDPGCPLLTGVQALQYARSRHYEELRDGAWREDPTSDLGRSARQRDFVNRAIQGALDQVRTDPFATGRLVAAISTSLHVDPGLDPLQAVDKLRSAVSAGLVTYSLPVVGTTIGGNAVLILGDGAQPVLDYFRGVHDAPAPAG